MKIKKALIIGFGSIGRRHYKILKDHKIVKNIKIFSSQEIVPNKLDNLNESIKFDPDLIIIASTTNTHLKYIKFIEKNLKEKKVLIEKPVFNNYIKLKLKNNKYFIGYNFRYDPVLNYIKKLILNEKLFSVICQNYSYLPDWRKNRDYSKTSSAQKKYGGGVLRDLSHEIDYIVWLFGKVKINYSHNKKISNLKINTDDELLINCLSKKVKNITISINFYSKFLLRKVYVYGDNLSIEGDLINKKVKYFKKNKYYEKSWNKNNKDLNYVKQLKDVIKEKNIRSCTYKDGLNILKLIKVVEKKSFR